MRTIRVSREAHFLASGLLEESHSRYPRTSARPLSTLIFRPLTPADLPTLHEWLQRPHVARWWGPVPSPGELAADFAPAIAGAAAHWAYIALRDGVPIGFIQAYAPVGWHHEGWWLDEHDPGVRGIDQFLADASQLGQGLGTAMVRAFVADLLRDPAVTRIQTDPAPDNGRAIRCYEKAGFRAAREVVTLDGPALLMYCERPGSGSTG
jgi:aminoglycoside 6'-N-acetyltransferase Ib